MAKESLPRKSPPPVPHISQRSLRRLFVHASDACALVDLDGGLVDANPAAERLFGRARRELIGCNALHSQAKRIPSRYMPPVAVTLDRLHGGPTVAPHEFVVSRPDGTEVVVEASGIALFVGRRRMVLALLRDVTEQRQIAERFQAKLAQVARLSMAGQMAACTAHEINQAMSVICNFSKACELLLQQTPPDLGRLAQWHQEITKAAHHAAEIVQRVRDFDRIAPFRVESTGLAQLVEQAMVLVQTEWPVRPTAIDWDPEAEETRVEVDRLQIVHVLVNLLRNAVDAIGQTSKSGRITVRARRVGRFVEVAVADDGPGLPGDLAQRVFEPFVTNKPAGLGIGLALSRLIVEAHGGALWGENGAVEGAVFRFTLPVASTAPGSAPDGGS